MAHRGHEAPPPPPHPTTAPPHPAPPPPPHSHNAAHVGGTSSRAALLNDPRKAPDGSPRRENHIGSWLELPKHQRLYNWRVRGWFCLSFAVKIGPPARI